MGVKCVFSSVIRDAKAPSFFSTLVLRFRTYPNFRATMDTSAISVDFQDLIVNKTLNADSRGRKPGLHRHPPTGDWL